MIQVMSRPVQTNLSHQLRQYALDTGVIQLCPTKVVLLEAIAQHFPGQISDIDNPEELLERIGIVVIEDLGHGFEPKRISWSITNDMEVAIRQVDKFMQNAYRAVRKAFGIDYHWIFYVPNQDLLNFDNEQLQEAIGEFREDGLPECWICDWFWPFD